MNNFFGKYEIFEKVDSKIAKKNLIHYQYVDYRSIRISEIHHQQQ